MNSVAFALAIWVLLLYLATEEFEMFFTYGAWYGSRSGIF
jgi:uncharacterized membrane protein YccC